MKRPTEPPHNDRPAQQGCIKDEPGQGIIESSSCLQTPEWMALGHRIQQNLADAPNIVTLDVGGTIIKTSKHTLLRFKGSYFHVLLGSGLWSPDSPGKAYFLDFEPVLFRRVLQYLRTGVMTVEGLTEVDRDELGAMVKYLNLPVSGGHAKAYWWDPTAHAPEIALSNELRTIQRLPSPRVEYRAAMAAYPLSGRVRLRVDYAGAEFYLGVNTSPEFDLERSPWEVPHYSYRSDGKVLKHGAKIASLPRIQSGDILTVSRQTNTHVEFALNKGQPVRVALADPTEALYLKAMLLQQPTQLTILD